MLTFNFKAQTSEMDSKSPTKKYIFTIFLQEGGGGGKEERGKRGRNRNETEKHNQTLKQVTFLAGGVAREHSALLLNH